jgi:hypothetical protein
MKVLDNIRAILGLIAISAFFYLLTDNLIGEYEEKQTHFKIEFNSGRIYWADSVHVVSENEINFFDIDTKRNVKMYGQFTISTPKNK